jgi:PhoPQ-activated pathogenicity-related protein
MRCATCGLAALVLLIISQQLIAKGPSPASLPVTALADYVKQPDPSYSWTKRHGGKLGAGTFAELTLTSQTWQGIVWRHQLFVYRPAKVTNDSALLLISGSDWRDELAQPPVEDDYQLPTEAQVLARLADQMQSVVAVVCQVPEQPIFDGKHEDQIISYTFAKYYETDDANWPLLLPMVKAAVRAMDAVQEFSAQQWQQPVTSFLVSGASKRGWTTWLTAAADPRVAALAPMVINMLNMEPHMKLQEASFGGYSEEIHDYTERGLHKLMASERGRALRTIVDPYSYLDEIRQPKLIILGTNDRYWPVDSLNLYWDALEGEKYVLYVPNNGHDLQDYPRILGTVMALQQSVVAKAPLPKLEWKFEGDAKAIELKLQSDRAPTQVAAWTATSKSRDFRDAGWSSQVVAPQDGSKSEYAFSVSRPEFGYKACFLELTYPGKTLPFYLSSGLRVVAAAGESDEALGE